MSETKKFSFGDSPQNIDLPSTLSNALKREGIDNFNLHEDDLEVYETEHLTSCATVLMIDISHSMILYGEDRITPAKQVALALVELIQQKFPKDYLACVVFGDDAALVSLAEMPFISVGPFHTNTKAGLELARHLLRRKGNVNKQIFMVTDGKPSAMFEENGTLYKNPYGLDQRIVNKTIDEAVELAKLGKGSLVCSIITADDKTAKQFVIGAACMHGRILVLNAECAKESTGHGSPMPMLNHSVGSRAAVHTPNHKAKVRRAAITKPNIRSSRR